MISIFVFWQNTLSIHQSAFLKSLSSSQTVYLVVEKAIEEHRLKDGWLIPDFGKAEIIVAPNADAIHSLLDIEGAVHVFSGLNQKNHPTLSKALDLALAKNVKFGTMSEPFDWLGWKGKLRFLRYLSLKIKYNKSLLFILAIGDKGRWCYQQTGFDKDKIYDWGYFTKKIMLDAQVNEPKTEKPSFVFIGRLNEDKGIVPLVSFSLNLTDKFSKFTIIGRGEYEDKIKALIANNDQFEYLGTLTNDEVYPYLMQSDICILPSTGKDGWGAVVNEALMCGTPVIASDRCGASVLLGEDRGEVFSIEKNKLKEVLGRWLSKGIVSVNQRAKLQEWASNNISGEVAASYFMDIMNHVLAGSEKPEAPWLKKKKK